MTKMKLWVVGDYEHSELSVATNWLRGRAECVFAESVAELLGQPLPGEICPTAIVLAAARPGRFRAEEIEELHRKEPLAALVVLLGTFCEGEIRTGRPWPGVTRIYWHQWQTRLPAAVGLSEPATRRNRLPRTANEMDIAHSLTDFMPPMHGALIAICTSQRAMYDTLADVCTSAGCRSFWQLPGLPLQARGVDALLVDGEYDFPIAGEAQAKIPRIALLDFPRHEDYHRALAAGAFAVVSKPFQLADLFGALHAAMLSSGKLTVARRSA